MLSLPANKNDPAAAYVYLLKNDFKTFAIRCLKSLIPDTPFQDNFHIDLIIQALEDCMNGTNKRLIVNLPPRHLKSLLISVIYPAWILAKNPSAKIICASYGQDLAEKHALDCRMIITSDWYQSLFPDTRLIKNSAQELITSKNGCRYSVSVGGPIIGRGADYIIIDDPLKPDDALSDKVRKSVNDWFNSNARTRLDNKAHGRIIIVMQRLHVNDLVGHVQENEEWKVLAFPAIAIEDETHVITSKFKGIEDRIVIRRAGEALHPAREPLEVLEKQRRDMGEYHFAGQYQQCPSPLGGGMVKEAWFKFYHPAQLPEKFDQIVQSLDTASKEGELNDYSVCTTWGIKGKNIYLLNVYRKKLNFPDLKRAVIEQMQLFQPAVVLVEDKSSGTALIQDLIADGYYSIKKCSVEGTKIMRMHNNTGAIENGFVYLPEEAHWLAEYIHELITFPKGKHDDQVDSTSQFLAWIKSAPFFPGWGMLEYMRQEYEKLQEN